MSFKIERYHLPPNYYVQVSPWISLSVVGFMWILFPIFAFCPNSLDFIINDYFGDILERNSHYLVKLFNVQVWVRKVIFVIHITVNLNKKICQLIPPGGLNLFLIQGTNTDQSKTNIFSKNVFRTGFAAIIFPKSARNQNWTPLLL